MQLNAKCFVKTTSPGLQNYIDHIILSFQWAFHFPTSGTWYSQYPSSQHWPKLVIFSLVKLFCCLYLNSRRLRAWGRSWRTWRRCSSSWCRSDRRLSRKSSLRWVYEVWKESKVLSECLRTQVMIHLTLHIENNNDSLTTDKINTHQSHHSNANWTHDTPLIWTALHHQQCQCGKVLKDIS